MTDDCALAEAAGLKVAVVAGAESNLKITEPADLVRAEQILAAGLRPRTGMGFDVHRLGPGDGMVLMGVRLPGPWRLIGHSDADVGLHALTDALLGALCAGDIGSHFPPSEPRWGGADSALFLCHARDLVAAAGGVIEHVDATLICERPEDRPAPAGHGRAGGGAAAGRAGAGQHQGDHHRAPGIRRAWRGHRRPGGGHRLPARLMAAAGLRATDPACLLATWFGAGRLPRAPGTWGSLAALPFAAALAWLGGPWLVLLAALAVFGLGMWASDRYMAAYGVHDPGAIVVDEVVGQWLTLALLPLTPIAYLLGFVLFRITDMVKPWPARLDRSQDGRRHRRDARRRGRGHLCGRARACDGSLAAMTFPAQSLTLAKELLAACEARGWHLASAESCTGGLIVGCLTEIAGSSSVVERGYVTYDNRAKQEVLGVPAALLQRVGAVSEEVARAMAEGARERAKVDLAIAVTGIAGPGGATPTKPVGLVHMAVARARPADPARRWRSFRAIAPRCASRPWTPRWRWRCGLLARAHLDVGAGGVLERCEPALARLARRHLLAACAAPARPSSRATRSRRAARRRRARLSGSAGRRGLVQ